MSYLATIKLRQIHIDWDVARAMDRPSLFKLAMSIQERGMSSTITVRPIELPKESPQEMYSVVIGVSRVLAARILHYHSPDWHLSCYVLTPGEKDPIDSSTAAEPPSKKISGGKLSSEQMVREIFLATPIDLLMELGGLSIPLIPASELVSPANRLAELLAEEMVRMQEEAEEGMKAAFDDEECAHQETREELKRLAAMVLDGDCLVPKEILSTLRSAAGREP